ncbi:MAG: hypothetical protein H7Y42_12325 [Chitinophagaceae bacterium]|nr:hypothetical protein [Chitinophagaceae bacterium]
MKLIDVNSLVETPLAGFIIAEMEEGSEYNFINVIELKLQLLTSIAETKDMVVRLLDQSESLLDNHPEYFINELQHEYRRAVRHLKPNFSDEYELKVLNQWISILMEKYNQDYVLDFLSQVKANRERRKGMAE